MQKRHYHSGNCRSNRKKYGHHYSPATISNITKLVDEDVKALHARSVQERYVVVFCDATFIPVRRDTVQREAMHTLIGTEVSFISHEK